MKTPTNIIPIGEDIAPEDDRLIEYRQLRENRLARPLEGAPEGVFIAEGDKVVKLLLERSLYQPRSLLLADTRRELATEFAEMVGPGVPVYLASRPVMDEIVGFPIHRGVLASGIRRPMEPVSAVLKGAKACVVLEGLSNHDNVGGLMRVAAALGGVSVTGVPACPLLLDPTSCDPLYRKSIRVSMGHALRVPFTRVPDWPGGLTELTALGFTTIALTTDEDAEPIGDVVGIDRPALLLGAEGSGLSQGAQRSVDVRVRIPMSAGVDSLNVVAAGAIALSKLVDPGLACEPNPPEGV